MPKVTIVCDDLKKEYIVDNDTPLFDLMVNGGVEFPHPCGGTGRCKKCTVSIDGKEELSCRYVINKDVEVVVPSLGKDSFFAEVETYDCKPEKGCFCLDIGTTTLSLALVDASNGTVIDVLNAQNPQSVFGADVISRIDYCRKNGSNDLHKALTERVNVLCAEMIEKHSLSIKPDIYVAGNTTMLHTFFNVDCSSLGVSPYEPVFIREKRVNGADIGLFNIDRVVALPGISAFVGADIVAGLNGIKGDGIYLFVDLGTNAEIVLATPQRILCTSAAAGPCFEGGNISCGMRAVTGSIFKFSTDGNYSVIGGGEAKGVCASGLIDIMAFLLNRGIIDETGYMEKDFAISRNVCLTDGDVRQYQLAKSAVFSAILSLLNVCGLYPSEIDEFFVSGGFSNNIDVDNAIKTGLFPAEFKGKFHPMGNTCIKGLAKYAAGENKTDFITSMARYVDLSSDAFFTEQFINNLDF